MPYRMSFFPSVYCFETGLLPNLDIVSSELCSGKLSLHVLIIDW